MESVLEKSLAGSRAFATSVVSSAEKAIGPFSLAPTIGNTQVGIFGNHGANRERYARFTGWLYSAVHAIASEAASQPLKVGRITGKRTRKQSSPDGMKMMYDAERRKMPAALESKASRNEIEVLMTDPIIDQLSRPNPVQNQWQFIYSFIANLCLTGRSYLVAGKGKNGEIDVYSLPTTWITPDHSKGPYTKFWLRDPRNPGGQGVPLDAEMVARVELPNPADPLGAISPAATQMPAVRIDDHIQNSQERFFENGIFPSVLVTVGKNPHPDVPGGVRPRLTGVQRRQVYAAITKTMGGIANYGVPGILDGMIERIDRLSATSNEMGWEKSEKVVRTRILSSYGIHPYILGEPTSVGGYAQAFKIEERFCKRVNVYMDLFGSIITVQAPIWFGTGENILIWLEKCAPHDPQLHWSNLKAARTNGDITRNEFRAELGLPPDDTGGDRTKQWNAGDVNALVNIQTKVTSGEMSPEQGQKAIEVSFDMEPAEAKKLAGEKGPDPIAITPPSVPPPEQEGQGALGAAVEQLDKATQLLLGSSAIDADIVLGVLGQRNANQSPNSDDNKSILELPGG